ncbi:MAG: hypothetical protein KGL18_17715, partial [Burkholderiales bacterium]|nr:hypothetical protein [Burkholderiales bacterium]
MSVAGLLDPEDLRRPPFSLGTAELGWVTTTYASLSMARRLAQLFNVAAGSDDAAQLATIARVQPAAVTPGACGDRASTRSCIAELQARSDLPLLVSADLEGGAISAGCFTPMLNQLGAAAMASDRLYEEMVEAMALEARALGFNWSFTPVVDINAEFRSSIVGTRSFGSDRLRIARMALIHVRTLQRLGVAATAKHWPGEGFDARDQHLVTTLNPLSLAQWRDEFGTLYRRLIESGVLSIMSAHIAWPAYARACGEQGLETCRPASLSRHLNLGLLRGELGFAGLIVSDATLMGGLGSWGPRRIVIPELIENGCDMILFTRDIDGDIGHLLAAIEDGRLTMERVEAAVLRVLALKAALGLHRRDAAIAASAPAG